MSKVFAASFLALSLSAIPGMAQSSATVRDAQQALKDKGYDPGTVDGLNGPATRAATKKYQDVQHLDEDGRLGPKTLDSLGVKHVKSSTQMKAGGEQVKNGYSEGGKQVAEGSKDLGHEVKKGEVGAGAADFGKGVGHGATSIGKSTGHAAKSVAKGIKNAVTPDSKEKPKP